VYTSIDRHKILNKSETKPKKQAKNCSLVEKRTLKRKRLSFLSLIISRKTRHADIPFSSFSCRYRCYTRYLLHSPPPPPSLPLLPPLPPLMRQTLLLPPLHIHGMRLLRRLRILLPNLNRLICLTRQKPRPTHIKSRRINPRLTIQ